MFNINAQKKVLPTPSLQSCINQFSIFSAGALPEIEKKNDMWLDTWKMYDIQSNVLLGNGKLLEFYIILYDNTGRISNQMICFPFTIKIRKWKVLRKKNTNFLFFLIYYK